MDDLIEALQIFRKYGNPQYPTYCMRDELRIADINPADVTQEDKDRLSMLGFEVSEDEDGYFYSFKFGSC